MYLNYNTNQTYLPLELSAMLPHDHIIYTIDSFIESLDETIFESYHHVEGRPSYSPKLLIKALLFAYSRGIFSGRKIEELMTENIAMQWLTGQTIVSYRTINRFRTLPITQSLIADLFSSCTAHLQKESLITLEHAFIDGTKIEANANKYTFVWKKSIEKYEKLLKEKALAYYHQEIEPLIHQAITLESSEQITTDTLSNLTALLEEEIQLLNQEIQEQPVQGKDWRKKQRRTLKKHHRKVKDDFLNRKTKYDHHLEVLNENQRNSYSKTDVDATFMRMKEDHMMNGQLKAGYNVQIATENQFVLHYDVFHNPTDTRTLIPFINSMPFKPQTIIADAGYGSEENYNYLAELGMTGLIKYTMFDKETKKAFKYSVRNLDNWQYIEYNNTFIHPDGTVYYYAYTSHAKNGSGFRPTKHIYKPEVPEQAPQKALYFNANFQEQKQLVKENLSSVYGAQLYRQRSIDVEPVFGQLKACLGFTRCHLRGKDKVKVDLGLAFMANNLKKMNKLT